MKIFLSTDIEGTAGIVDWGQVLGSGEYEMGRRLLQNEVNAAIDGAADGGRRRVRRQRRPLDDAEPAAGASCTAGPR